MDESVWPDERAGWWRRTLALLVDSLCAVVPSIGLGALLFATTNGFIQWAQPGLQWQVCTPVSSIPRDLEPSPPPNSNRAAVCRSYSLLGQIVLMLVVGRTTQDQGTTSSVFRQYGLQLSGQNGVHDVSWITYVMLLALLIGGEWRWGVTPGKWLLGIRVVAAENPVRRSVPVLRIATRYGIAIAGVVLPLGLALAIVLVPVALGGDPPTIPIPVFILLIVLASAWQIWNLVRIVRRRASMYDYIARVEVIRSGSRSPNSVSPEAPGLLPA